MENLLIKIIDVCPWLAPPIALVLLFMFRKRILNLFRKTKLIDPVREWCQETKYILEFSEKVFVETAEEMTKILSDIILKAKREKKYLIFDFSYVENVNDEAEKALREIIYNNLKQDDFAITFIFPEKLHSLYSEFVTQARKKNVENVKIIQVSNLHMQKSVFSGIADIKLTIEFSTSFDMKELHDIERFLGSINGIKKLTFDFTNLRWLDSAIIGMMVFQARHIPVTIITGGSEQIKQAIRIASMDKVFNVIDHLEEVKQ
jgi:anti-anti-sigma regulatory factor